MIKSILLEGNHVKLCSVTRKHYNDMFKLYNDKKFRQATGVMRFVFHDQLDDIINNDGTAFYLAISHRKSSEFLGAVKGFTKKGWLYINMLAIREEHKKNGYGKDTIIILENYFKNKYGIKKVCLSVLKDNASGQAFWTKLGYFVLETKRKEAIDNFKRDVFVFGKTLL